VSETNGHGESRLDRIERILERHSSMIERHDAMIERHDAMMVSIDASIERQVLANEAARERFESEDKRLLTAQILMNGAMQKMAEGMVSLESKMEETTGKLNALIDTVDGVIRKRP
jgi:hypothetical protein